MLCTVRTCTIGWVLCLKVQLRLAVPRGFRESVYFGALCVFTDCLCFQLSEAGPKSFGKVGLFFLSTLWPSGKDSPSLSLKDRRISLLETVSNSVVPPYGFEIPHSYRGCISALSRGWLWPLLPSSSQQCWGYSSSCQLEAALLVCVLMATLVPGARLLEESWDSRAASPLPITWHSFSHFLKWREGKAPDALLTAAAEAAEAVVAYCCYGCWGSSCWGVACINSTESWGWRGMEGEGGRGRERGASEHHQTRKSIYILGSNWLNISPIIKKPMKMVQIQIKMRADHPFNARTCCVV